MCDIVTMTTATTASLINLTSSAKDSKSLCSSIIPGLSCGADFPFKEFGGLCGRCQFLSSADELEREKYMVRDASILSYLN